MPLLPDLFLRDSHFGNSVLKTARKIGEVTGINLVDKTSELMVISQFGKIIRIDTESIRAAGRSTQGVKLLDQEPQDKVAAAVVSPQKKAKIQPEEGTRFGKPRPRQAYGLGGKNPLLPN